MAEFKIKIHINADEVLGNLDKFRRVADAAIEKAVELTATQLMRDVRPRIPLLTGALRDSGQISSVQRAMHNYAFSLVWNAANPRNSYIYATRQYEEVFQHVDGKYAAKWVSRTIDDNPGRYTFLVTRFLSTELNRSFGR